MKTTNYGINLMVPGQAGNNEIAFNEAIAKIDNFLNIVIKGFLQTAPEHLSINEKYIITDGEHVNHICYIADASKGIEYMKLQDNMIFFILEENSFFMYANGGVQKLSFISNNAPSENTSPSIAPSAVSAGLESTQLLSGNEKFYGISEYYEAPKDQDYLYLYINSDVEVNFDQIKTRQVTILIKQHYQSSFNLTWPGNILWQNKEAHQMTKTPNSMDMVRLHRLIESNHFIGEIIGQGYQF